MLYIIYPMLYCMFRVDMDQFIRKQAVDLFREQHPEEAEDLDPEDFEYYEFQGLIFKHHIKELVLSKFSLNLFTDV